MKFVDDNSGNSFQDPSKDAPNVREVYFADGRTVKMERRDPFGFIHIVWDSGSPPAQLRGTYTTFELARSALMIYANSTYFAVSPEPVVKAPVLQYKQPKAVSA